MGSLRITTLRKSFPGMTDQSAAAAYAEKHGYVAIVRYKNASSSADFTDVGTCDSEAAIQAYLRSPNCHGAEIIYDGRSTLFALTADHILNGRCQICAKRATRDTFEMGSGNDFYFCPKCGLLFCEGCYASLPLTSSPGYGICPSCRVEVKRAISYFFASDTAVPAATFARADDIQPSADAAQTTQDINKRTIFLLEWAESDYTRRNYGRAREHLKAVKLLNPAAIELHSMGRQFRELLAGRIADEESAESLAVAQRAKVEIEKVRWQETQSAAEAHRLILLGQARDKERGAMGTNRPPGRSVHSLGRWIYRLGLFVVIACLVYWLMQYLLSY